MVVNTFTFLGPAARHDWGWYFEGESSVVAATLDQVHAWLQGCEYRSDVELFQERDFWQHPRTFEQLRKGDCEDFALWAWRRLLELGYEAYFVMGRYLEESEAASGRHAWVVFRRDGQSYVYEPTKRELPQAVQLLDLVRQRYIPEFGVGPDRRGFAYCGYLLSLREERGANRPTSGWS